MVKKYHRFVLFSAAVMTFLMFLFPKSYPQVNPLPKNIIVLICDGWGINQINAANYWHGVDSTTFQKFPVHYFMSTFQGTQVLPDEDPALEGFRTGYNSGLAWSDTNYVKVDYTDSAPAATTMASGNKSSNLAIGVDVFGNSVELITESAVQLGKLAGVVSSVPWSHATPAAFATHNINRNNYFQIALGMLLESKLSVIMGCGNPAYDDNSDKKSLYDYGYVGGQATWDTLISGMTNTYSIASLNGRTEPMDIDGDDQSDAWTLIQDSIDFVNLMTALDPPIRVLGTAKCATTLNQKRYVTATLPYQDNKNDSVPHLYQMALAAINILKESPEGFILMVEGGAVDWANHANQKQRLIEEQQDFNIMVDSVVSWIEYNGGWDENLLIVTGDHECGYLTGPDYDQTNITDGYYIIDNGKGEMPGMKYNSNEHSNMLIPLYAKGTGSELFHLYADETDYLFGYYIDNTEVGLVCKDLLRSGPFPVPKNIIYMIGDGMGFNHSQATNQFKGQSSQPYQNQLAGADFLSAAISTYPGTTSPPSFPASVQDYDVWYNSTMAWTDSSYITRKSTDSAPAATSMFSGKKTATGAIGIDYRGNELNNIADRAFQIGKSIGVVSSVQFSQATSAAFAAHNMSPGNYSEIANEMIIDSKLSVLFGCGAPDFNDDGQEISPTEYRYVGGPATWDELLQGSTVFSTLTIHDNQTVQDINGDGNPDAWLLVRDSLEFTGYTAGKTPLRLIGIPKTSATLNQARTRTGSPRPFEIPFNRDVPTLSDMTKAALNVLDNNENGFVLVINGGAIDRASSSNQLERVIEEQDDFNQAVAEVIYWVNSTSNWESTLLIITGSHETGYLVGQYYNSSNMIDGYPVVDNGKDNLPSGQFLLTGHTNQLVPFYAHGCGAGVIAGYATHHDFVYGKYINNTEAAQAILKMWRNVPEAAPDINPSEIITDIGTVNSANIEFDDIKVYPGIVHDFLYISFQKPMPAVIQIYNMNGSLVRNISVNGSVSLDLTDIPAGMYILMAITDNTTHTVKFIKQK